MGCRPVQSALRRHVPTRGRLWRVRHLLHRLSYFISWRSARGHCHLRLGISLIVFPCFDAISTCISVSFHSVTTIANQRPPASQGRSGDNSVEVIIRSACCQSSAGSGSAARHSRRPGIHRRAWEGMGSSIALTPGRFRVESAAQNSVAGNQNEIASCLLVWHPQRRGHLCPPDRIRASCRTPIGGVDSSLRPRLRPYFNPLHRQISSGAGRDSLLVFTRLAFTICRPKSASDDHVSPPRLKVGWHGAPIRA